jgi:glutamate 5-kinase
MLLTRADFDDRARFLNLRNCVTQLHRMGCIPIINENDTVAVEELRFGDNDMLAALVCNALPADALILLTVVDGVLTPDGQPVDLITDPRDAHALARAEKTALGTGGISSKIQATRTVTDAGVIAVIANGRVPNLLLKLLDAKAPKLGTVFTPAMRKLDSRRRWIGLTRRPAGTLIVDDGAAHALTTQGKSLLAIGILDLQQKFAPGQVVRVTNTQGAEIARGLTNYSHLELELIKGKRSNQFEKLLGRPAYAEVIHRDNMVLVGQ